MRPARYAPGRAYYGMAVLALLALASVVAGILGVFAYDNRIELAVAAVLAVVGLCALVAGWRSFTLRREGLAVRDLKGSRVHAWDTLGRPRTREFVHGAKGSLITEMDGQPGFTSPEAYSHFICDDRGRRLYRVGPWYPQRREMMREIRRRVREAHE